MLYELQFCTFYEESNHDSLVNLKRNTIRCCFEVDLLFKTNDDIFHSIVNSFKGKKNLLNTLLHTIPFLKAYQSRIPALIGIVNGAIASLINSLSYSTYNLPHIYLSSLINCANYSSSLLEPSASVVKRNLSLSINIVPL